MNHLTDEERERLMGAVIAKMHDKAIQVVPVVESILAARETALREREAKAWREGAKHRNLAMGFEGDCAACFKVCNPYRGQA